MLVQRKKMTFQLTPLLDLLLIVIFAQFMEVQQSSVKLDETLETRAAEMRQTMLDQAAELRKKMDAAHAQRIAEVNQRSLRYAKAFRSLKDQQEQSGQVLAELFNVPESTVNQLLRIDPKKGTYTPKQAQELKNTLRQLQQSNGRELLRMLISYGEMRKRCDMWEVHVTDDNVIEFDNGQTIQKLNTADQESIEDGLFSAYKSSPEPKTLVIFLFSYGDASAGAWQRARDALPVAVARMREDSGKRNWFEYAVLGFTPEGPSLRAKNQ